MTWVIETEVDVSLKKDSYILVGRVDLRLGADNKLESLDFKSQPQARAGHIHLITCRQQFIYAPF